MKELFYLEDAAFLRKQTLEYLEEDGFIVKSAGRIDQAIDFVEKHPNEIDCIITDLNMNDEWLNEYRSESNGCLMSGWVWLRHFVYSKDQFQNTPCIIYSGYIPDLKDYLSQRNEMALLEKYPIHCIQKGGNDDNGYAALVKSLEKIFRK